MRPGGLIALMCTNLCNGVRSHNLSNPPACCVGVKQFRGRHSTVFPIPLNYGDVTLVLDKFVREANVWMSHNRPWLKPIALKF